MKKKVVKQLPRQKDWESKTCISAKDAGGMKQLPDGTWTCPQEIPILVKKQEKK